jgi:hypothetical protein
MQMLTRPVAPYIVPVPGFVRPDGVADQPAPELVGAAKAWA